MNREKRKRNEMFRENKKHLQKPLLSTLNELPEAQRQLLEKSWAGSFRQEVFGRLDESVFSVLYAQEGSRPNVAVNVLMGLEILKAGFGWSDEELYEAFLFNLQVRYALGYERVGEGYFAIRTLYEFRQRLREWMCEHGENLVEKAFCQITDGQVHAFALKTETLRMDSTQIASDICRMSRLQLLVEIVLRVHRILSEQDCQAYAPLLAPYLATKANGYVYRLKKQETEEHLAAIGGVIARLVRELAAAYAQEPMYALLVRVFNEHFVWQAEQVRLKAYEEVGSQALQSPDDPQATYRRKAGHSYVGYVANVTESCDPSNPLQLIVKVQTQSNATDDIQLLEAALPELSERTEVKTLLTDGGFNSPTVEPLLKAAQVEHIQTALRGDHPHGDCISLVDFVIECNEEGIPLSLRCPQGQQMAVEAGNAPFRFIARPQAALCLACPLLSKCRARPKPSCKTPTIYFELRHLQLTLRRQQMAASPSAGNPRAAIEATIRSLKQPFRHGKLLVRGAFRVSCLLLASALMVNCRRLHTFATDPSRRFKKKGLDSPFFFSLPFSSARSCRQAFFFTISGWDHLYRCLLFSSLAFSP
jgi:hypothetical protein